MQGNSPTKSHNTHQAFKPSSDIRWLLKNYGSGSHHKWFPMIRTLTVEHSANSQLLSRSALRGKRNGSNSYHLQWSSGRLSAFYCICVTCNHLATSLGTEWCSAGNLAVLISGCTSKGRFFFPQLDPRPRAAHQTMDPYPQAQPPNPKP